MIGSLKGTVAAFLPDTIILDVSGVGYELTVTAAVLSRAAVGSELTISVYTDVRENAINLFGFADAGEKAVFLLLRKVKGIGSKTATAVLSSIGSNGVLKSIATGDHDALQAIPGIGKKTAARLVVELREQVVELVNSGAETAVHAGGSAKAGPSRTAGKGTVSGLSRSIEIESRTIESDVILALEKLGFSKDRARQAVQTTLDSAAAGRFEQAGELLKQVLLNI